jgi:hypothetical protein
VVTWFQGAGQRHMTVHSDSTGAIARAGHGGRAPEPSPKHPKARAEAWEGKDPGGFRVLLANPRWERRFIKFLELSGAGRVMERMRMVPLRWTSRWCGMRRREQPLGVIYKLLFPYFTPSLLGGLVPRSAPPRVEDLICCSLRRRAGDWFP